MNDKPGLRLNSNLATIILGIVLILLGVLFLVGRSVASLFHFDLGHYAWPFFIIIPGLLVFLAAFLLEPRAGIGLAMLGGMITMTGSILFIQNLFDLYASWAYAWALAVPTAAGLAMLVYGALRGLGQEVKNGLSLAGIGAALFVGGAFFFEVVIGLHGFGFGLAWFCWPMLLIGLGALLLVGSLLRPRTPPSA